MKYLLLIRGDESAAEHADDGCGGWDTEMAARGVLVQAGGLRPPAEGKAVRVRRRKLLLSDGPFAETKEQVGGYCVISCASMAEAVDIAAAHPAAAYATIEIRQML
jgi:hypothetical protein